MKIRVISMLLMSMVCLWLAGCGNSPSAADSAAESATGQEQTVETEQTNGAEQTNDDEMTAFLFRLGCYEGEPVTLISKKRKGCVVAIKDGRYSLDKQLASAVLVEANN